MILAQELRIGNVFRGIGGIQTVLSLEENTERGRCNYSSEQHRLMYSHLILCHQNGNQYKPFEIEPIKLTDEILINLKFNKKSDFEYRISALKFRIYRGGKIWYSYIGDIYLGDLIQNVHTLQNFIHSFGKEIDTSKIL